MYSIYNKKIAGEILVWNKFDGFPMRFRKGFSIDNDIIKTINVINNKLAAGLVTKKVMGKYNKLIPILTELVLSDDDTGDAFREALNQIEKFRLEIKNKYRKFLEKKDLEFMSKQLTILKIEAKKRIEEINYSLMETKNNGKGK